MPKDPLPGLAHVTAVSFLASRIAPGGQFWIALAGGIALARAGQREGARAGYGASAAAILETVALIGPARINGPMTQALNAPLVGRLHPHRWAQLGACLGIRLAHYLALNLLAIWLLIGGVDELVATYDKIVGILQSIRGFLRLPEALDTLLPEGRTPALVLTVAMNLVLALFYSTVQVWAYRRALRRWDAEEDPADPVAEEEEQVVEDSAPRAGARVLVIAALVIAGWVVLIISPAWPVIGATAAALGLLAVVVPRRGDAGLRLALILGGLLAFGAMMPVFLGAVGTDVGVRRALRALLLVLIAAWARSAAGSEGVRSLAGAGLWRLGARRAARLTAILRGDRRLAESGRDLLARLDEVPTKPVPIADALTSWVVAEARRAP